MFITIQQQYELNGDRHLARANRYLADDNIEYAEGSLKKAEKNYKIAELLEPDVFTKLICDTLADKIADSIINGNT